MRVTVISLYHYNMCNDNFNIKMHSLLLNNALIVRITHSCRFLPQFVETGVTGCDTLLQLIDVLFDKAFSASICAFTAAGYQHPVAADRTDRDCTQRRIT